MEGLGDTGWPSASAAWMRTGDTFVAPPIVSGYASHGLLSALLGGSGDMGNEGNCDLTFEYCGLATMMTNLDVSILALPVSKAARLPLGWRLAQRKLRRSATA